MFYAKLIYDLVDDGYDQDTLDWWESVKKGSESGAAAYQEAFLGSGRVSPRTAMIGLIDFVDQVLKANINQDGSYPKAIFVARPAGFDRAFVNHYLMKHAPSLGNPFDKHSLDIKSLELGMALSDESATFDVKPMFGRKYGALSDIDSTEFDKLIGINPDAHTHNALDDAIHLAEVLEFLLEGEGMKSKVLATIESPGPGEAIILDRAQTKKEQK